MLLSERKVWRNDLNIVLFKMHKRTKMAFRMQVERVHAQQLRYEDRELSKAFKSIDADGSGTLEADELGPLLLYLAPEILGQGALLDTILDGVREKTTGGVVAFHQLRELMTAISLQVYKAQHDATSRKIFQDFDDDGSGTIDAAELEGLLRSFSGGFEERDLRHAKSFLDEQGEMDTEEFVDMMQSLALRKRSQQLGEEKVKREREYIEVFRHAAGGGRTISRRRMALCLNKLGLTVSKRGVRVLLRTIRLVEDKRGEDECPRQFYAKRFDDQKLILDELSRHFLFKNLSAPNREVAMMAMEPRSYESGITIITEGEDGTEFFVLLRGICDVFVDGVGRVHTYDAASSSRRVKANAFGELALIHRAPRAATVKCRSDCDLAVLSLKEFRRVQSRQSAQDGTVAEELESAMRRQTMKQRKASRQSTFGRFSNGISDRFSFIKRQSSRKLDGRVSTWRFSTSFGRSSIFRGENPMTADDESKREDDYPTATISGMHVDIDKGPTDHKKRAVLDDPDVVVSGLHAGRFADEDNVELYVEGEVDENEYSQEDGKEVRCHPLVKAVFSIVLFLKQKWARCWAEKGLSEEALSDERDRVTFSEYRRVIALVIMQKAVHYPGTKYRRDFENMFDDGTKGVVSIDANSLKSLLAANDVEVDDIEALNEVHALDRGDGKLLFDDFVSLMQRFHPEEVEHRLMKKLHSKAERLQSELMHFMFRVVLLPLMIIGALIMSFLKFLLNIYLIVASMNPEFTADMLVPMLGAIIEGLIMLLGTIFPALDLSLLEAFVDLDYSFLEILELPVSLKGGVTCVGMQAPLCKY